MSSAQFMARLAITGLPTFYFVSALTPDGGIPNQFVSEEEVLRDRGVDFDRWRSTGRHYEPFPMATIEDETSFANALSKKDAYIRAANKRGTLLYIAGGVTKTFRQVKVIGRPVPHPQNPRQQICGAGGLYGFGASTPSLAVLMAMWTIQLTEPAS